METKKKLILWNWYESRYINQNWNHESTKIETNAMRMKEKEYKLVNKNWLNQWYEGKLKETITE